MNHRNLKNHLYKHSGDVALLCHNGRCDNDIIAIILTEALFRPSYFLLCEFFIYQVLLIVCPARAKTVSLGCGQVQARHWNSSVTFRAIFDWIIAYDLVLMHLGKVNDAALSKKVACHVGERRKYYHSIATYFSAQLALRKNVTPVM